MLEKPDISDEKITAGLLAEYGLQAVRVEFLPLGVDMNTAVYRVWSGDGTAYFLKLRRGVFDETSVALPKYFHDQGISQIIAPLPTTIGQLWARLEAFTTILYPYIEGRDGYKADLSDRQWVEFGAALKQLHTTPVLPALTSEIQRETFSPRWRESVKSFLLQIDLATYDEPVAARLAAFLKAKRVEILDLLKRTERLARILQAQPPEFVVCHSDLHAGNLLIEASGSFYIVDWDNPILAPKERDLMFVGGGQGFGGHTPQEEVILFYQGYGQAAIDQCALAYYRCERIVEDIAVFCEQLLLSTTGGEDREQSFTYLKSNFLPGGTIEIACKTDKT